MATGLQRLAAVTEVSCALRADTGLRIGGTESAIQIGGIDNPVIRDPLTNRPFVPGSSLKGKMRSLLERRYELDQNRRISDIRIHTCEAEAAYEECMLCPLFGIPAPRESWFAQTRLRVFDAFLSEDSVDALRNARTDLPYAEVKTEVAIDRVTSAATPRSMERVPAGAVFAPVRLAVHRYAGDGPGMLERLIEGLSLLESDYLGGSGTRGSGRVSFSDISVTEKQFPASGPLETRELDTFDDLNALTSARDRVRDWLGTAN